MKGATRKIVPLHQAQACVMDSGMYKVHRNEN